MNMHTYAHFRELAWDVGIWDYDVYVTEQMAHKLVFTSVC